MWPHPLNAQIHYSLPIIREDAPHLQARDRALGMFPSFPLGDSLFPSATVSNQNHMRQKDGGGASAI